MALPLAEKLESFAREVPADLRFAFDFRDKSWLCDAVFAFLRARNWAYVIHQHPHLDTHVTTTASFAYVRLHGPAEPLHETSYSPEQLAEWAQIVHGIRARGVACHVFFLNDRFSPANAKVTHALHLRSI